MNTNYNKGSGTLSHREQMPNKIYRNQNEFKPHKIKYKNSARVIYYDLQIVYFCIGLRISAKLTWEHLQ